MALSQCVLVWLVSCAGTFAVAQEDSAARWAANARELNWQRQWAVEATASSSYSETGGWSVSQVLGHPDTTGYGDIGTAWAPHVKDGGIEWLELTYTWPMIPDSVQVVQSCGAGALKRVQLQPLGSAEWVTIEERQPQAEEMTLTTPLISSIDASRFGLPTRRVRVEIDTAVPGWNEIDAVGLVGSYVVGAPGSGMSTGAYRLWAENAQASSTYQQAERDQPWSAWQATGLPNSPAGDAPTAWAPGVRDGGMEWLQVELLWVISPTEINVHENCGPGFVRRIEAKDVRTDRWVAIWEGADTTQPPAGVLNAQVGADVHANWFRIHVDTSVPGWNEIDAVEIVRNPIP